MMDGSTTFPLLPEWVAGGPGGIKMNTGGGLGLAFPSNAVDFGQFADEVTFSASVRNVLGDLIGNGLALSASADTVTKNSHGLANGTPVIFTALVSATGPLLGPKYYVVNAATNTFQLATTVGGSPIDITADGTANIYGVPTTYKVGLKFQKLQSSTYQSQFQQRIWSDLHSYEAASWIKEGVGFGTAALQPPVDGSFGYIVDQTVPLFDGSGNSTPVHVQRTIRDFGRGVRLALDLPAAGATTPTVNLAITAVARLR